jgi:hypothetical protein
LSPWEKGILYLTVALTAGVLVKLWSSGLIKIYKLFFFYLTLDLFSTIGALTIPYDTNWYGYFYFSAQTLKIVTAAFVLVEGYWLALGRTPALAQFVRNGVGYILAAAALIPVILLWIDRGASNKRYLRAFFLFEQTMDATMAIFLILIVIFMSWFPVRLRRNVIVYIGGFIIWALSRSAGLHLVNLWSATKQQNQVINIIVMCVAVGCLLFWVVGLRPEGESRTAVVGHLWNRAEAERLTKQLETINDSIARMHRK